MSTLRACPILLLGCGIATLSAQSAFLPNLTYQQSELFKPLGTLHTLNQNGKELGLNNAAMHKGYLFTPFSPDGGNAGGGFYFWDISNPRKPVAASKKFFDQMPEKPISAEGHGFGFFSDSTGDYVAMAYKMGILIWNITDPVNPVFVKSLVVEPALDRGYDAVTWWVNWQAPWIWVSCGTLGLYLVDAHDVKNPFVVNSTPISKMGGFKVGPTFPVGNLLMFGNMGLGNNPGLATVDISDPKKPVLLDEDKSRNCYSFFLNGEKVYCAGLKNSLYVLDISNPANIRNGELIDQVGGPTPPDGSEGEYLHVQDNILHYGLAKFYATIDLSRMAIVQNKYRLADLDRGDAGFAIPLGNMVFVTDDHGTGSELVAHQAEPDKLGPRVNMISPKDLQVRQAVSSRVGLTFTDMIDLSSVNTKTFIVRKRGQGEALKGYYSSSNNIVNFCPVQPFQADATYEVVVPAGGIKDYAGNLTVKDTTIAFSTGATMQPVGIMERRATRLARPRASFLSPEGSILFTAKGGASPGSPATLTDSRGRIQKKVKP